MAIRKIQAGRITTVTTPNFIGEKGTIFYDETLADLRISDGHTPGGRLINIAGGLSDVLITDPQSGQTLQYNGTKWVNVNPGAIGLSTATITQLGGIKLGTGLQANGLGVVSVNTGSLGFTTYTLTTATAGSLGGVKIGNNLSITEDGTLSATSSVILSDTPPLDPTVGTLWYDTVSGRLYTWFDNSWIDTSPTMDFVLPTATATQLGGIKVGANLSINSSTGVLSATAVALTTASTSILGGIKVGDNLSINLDGTLNATSVVSSDIAPTNTNTLWYDTIGGRLYTWFDNNWIDASPTMDYTLPTATTTQLGGIKVGKDLSISNTGTLNLDLSAVTQNITPEVDAVYSLGTPSLKWKDIYVSTGSVYIGDLKLSSVNGALKVENLGNTGSGSSSVSIGTVQLSDYNSSLKISGPLTFPDGTTQTSAASSLEISEINTANSLTNTVTNVTAIRFDKDTGFSVTDLGAGQVKVSLGSSFKTWKVAGQSDIVAVGEDTVEFKAGDGISLTTNPTAPDKSMTISGYMYWSSRNW